MPTRIFCYFLFLPFLLYMSLHAQEPPAYELELKKDFVSWNWLSGLNTEFGIGHHTKLAVKNDLRSKLYRPSSLNQRWTDENNFEAVLAHELAGNLSTESVISSHVFADDNTQIEFSKNLAAQRLIWNAHPKVEIRPALGWALEDAFNQSDQGWYSEAGLKLSKIDMGGYSNNTELQNVLRSFPGRANQDFTLGTSWNKQFSQLASDSLRLGYQFSESRHYVDPNRFVDFESPQERVVINARFVFNQLSYRVSEKTQFALITNVKDRRIDQTNPAIFNFRDELTVENQFQLITTPGNWFFRTGALFAQRNDETPDERTNVNALQATLNQHMIFQPGPNDRIWTNFSYTKYEYNSPRADITEEERALLDDRDELRFIIDGGYQHRFSEYFTWALRSNIYLYHQIYLRSGRSANNNWNRIYQLATTADHKIGGRFDHRSEVKILANYTVFDFDEILPSIRSIVFRKLVYLDSLSLGLSDDLALLNIYQLELEDNGRFFKDDFSQQVTKELIAHFIQVMLHHRSFLGLQVSVGVNLQIRDEWSFLPHAATQKKTRSKSREYRSLTPRLTIIYPASRRLMLFLSYAPNRATNRTFRQSPAILDGETVQHFTSGNLRLQYHF